MTVETVVYMVMPRRRDGTMPLLAKARPAIFHTYEEAAEARDNISQLGGSFGVFEVHVRVVTEVTK